MNPNQAFANRTARLVREAQTPVYSTETKVAEREHLSVVEMDSGMGRYWSAPMKDSEVDAYIDGTPQSYDVSDIDHAAKCWCFRG